MKTLLAIFSIAAFTATVGAILVTLGVGQHHTDPLWAVATSVVFLITLLIDVWMFFAIAGEEAYSWRI